jgi:hypothetical protein
LRTIQGGIAHYDSASRVLGVVNGTGRYRINEQSWQVSRLCEKVWPLVIASMQAALDVIGAIDAKLARAGLAIQWNGHAISRLMGPT